jgi:hypothetical protein
VRKSHIPQQRVEMAHLVSREIAQTLLNECTHPEGWGAHDPVRIEDPVWVVPVGALSVVVSDQSDPDLALMCSAPDLARTVVALHEECQILREGLSLAHVRLQYRSEG